MDYLDRALLDELQAGLKLVAHPYADLAERLGVEETEVLDRIESLRQRHVIRQISAIFDSRKLGYQSSLVAFETPPGRVEQVAEIVNAHPGVSHNYERDLDFNLWFTIAVAPGGDVAAEVAKLARAGNVTRYHLLPTIQVFKVGVRLGMNESAGNVARSQAPAPEQAQTHARPTPREIAAIRILQQDLPAVSAPFAQLCDGAELPEEEALELGRQFLDDGRMRRFAAVLHHRDAGFEHNAMVLWPVPAPEVERVGPLMASFDAVSHCYHRPAFDDLPFTLYTMIHGRSTADCETVVASIAETTGVSDYRLVYSSREFKKVRVRYFEEA